MKRPVRTFLWTICAKHSLTYMKQFFFGVLETAGPNIATMQLSQVITALKNIGDDAMLMAILTIFACIEEI